MLMVLAQAVKDVYLPALGLWLSEYPYNDRTSFLEVRTSGTGYCACDTRPSAPSAPSVSVF
jgi:hypothetical protein